MNNKKDRRPLSPHLTIHKRVQPAVLSIIHRITGFGLSFGLVIAVIWIFLLAMGEKYFSITYNLFGTLLGKLSLLLFLFAISYHLINGIRYLIWSIGYGINMKHIYQSGYLIIIISIIATIQFWILIFYN